MLEDESDERPVAGCHRHGVAPLNHSAPEFFHSLGSVIEAK
jgi:hypothetical protein